MSLATAPSVAVPAPARNAYDVLQERGFVYQCSDEAALRQRLDTGPVTFYCGFDPTADSLQIGNMVPVMAMAHLQRAGHRPIAVVGGGTTMIGDPTGKTAARRIMSREEIDANTQVFKRQLSRYLDLSDGRGLLVDNAEWLLSLKYIEFLRDYGRHFSVNEMLRAETYRTRLEAGLTFLEFNYMLLQAYDFLVLYRQHGCILQIGGSDQWANVLAGTQLIRRTAGAQAFALTVPLVENADGTKMGKTAGGETIWLDPRKLSPYQFYQYWVNVADADVGRYLKLFTFLPLEEIEPLAAVEGAALREAKQRLAFEVTALAHGREAAAQAQQTAQSLFGAGGAGGGEVDAALEAVPTATLERAALEAGIEAIELLTRTGLAESRSRARDLIDGGGAYLHGERLTRRTIGTADLRDGALLLRAGKKRYLRVLVS
ncbi:MAG TPA: tyrosine--tRNA ligase [Chloroflexota bacterium]|nr:tyrosine--tRNA ligase [Chloroflexota bacterium]